MKLCLITDIPQYRLTQYPAGVKLTTWDTGGRFILDSQGFNELIRRLEVSIAAQGPGKGDLVCIWCNTGDTHLLAAELALMRLGCIIVPVHSALLHQDIQVIFDEVHPVCTITKSHVDIPALESLHHTGKILALDTLHTPPFDGVDNPDDFNSEDDTAMIIYTSGSFGTPKGVMLTHKNIISTVKSVLAVIPAHYRDKALSYLPVSHILERIAVYCYLTAGVQLHFAESPRFGMTLLKKIRPHYITAVPRILDRAVSNVFRAGDTRHYLLRSVILWALDTGEGKQHIFRSLARKLILGRLRASFGGRLKGILVGGAALNPSTEKIFRSAGVRLREGYGLTECCGVASLNRFEPGGNQPGTVGPVLPGVLVKIEESPGTGSGEILLKSDGVMQGYFLRPDETRQVISPDGWLKTGDRGMLIQQRFLKITGRVKEQFKNAFGEYVAPVKLEQLLEDDTWISRALILGAGKPYTGALIVPDFEVVIQWCREHKIHWTAPMYMVHNTELIRAFEKRVAHVNKLLSTHEQIQVFRLVPDEWSVESGLVTPSLKIRREVIEEHYKKVIEEMYKT